MSQQSNKEPSSGTFWYFIISAIGLYFLGCIVGDHTCAERYRRKALAAGVAHWVIDEKTGSSSFEYIKPK